LGVTFSYFNTNISEQPRAGNMLGEAGLLYQATTALTFGIYVFNPTQSFYSANTKERIPTIARAGVTYDVSDKLQMLGEAEETLNQKIILRGGLKYRIHEHLLLSAGAANNPVYLTFGAGVNMKYMRIDFAAGIHQVLGLTPYLAIVFPPDK
jgi:hypothetical protein